MTHARGNAEPRIVVYWYSQTGQLRQVAEAFTGPLAARGHRVEWIEITPDRSFPFPWPIRRFFGVFPDAVDPTASVEVAEPDPPRPNDLVVFAFQVWYLAPSLPMRALLASRPEAFAGRDVVGLVACRNMWYSAALEVRDRLTAAGARYLGTVAATDTASAAATFVTTLRWLLAGHREAFWRFPRAGVGEDELARLRRLGEKLAALGAGQTATGPRIQTLLAEQDAAPVTPAIAAADLLAGRAFRRWGRLIRAARRMPAARPALLALFVGWLCLAILAGLPAVAAARAVNPARFDDAVGRRLAPVLGGDGGAARR